MTPEHRVELQNHLAEHGLSVLMTRDYDAILIQLARLAQFERLIEQKAETDKRLSETIKMIRLIQRPFNAGRPADLSQVRPMEIIDVPDIVTVVHRALHDNLGKNALIDHTHIHAATAAFVGILFRR